MVYVDELKGYMREFIKSDARRYGRRWCHLWADTEEELHSFAARLGLKRAWFQDQYRHPELRHYDLVPSKRALALELGARKVTTKEWVQQYLDRRQIREQGGDRAEDSGDPRPA